MDTITVTGINLSGVLVSESININGISINQYSSIGRPRDFIDEIFIAAREHRARQLHKAKRTLRKNKR